MLPNSRQNAKQNLLSPVKNFAAALRSGLLGGCFQQSAPERIPTATTPEACLAAADTVQFAHLSALNGPLAAFPDGLDRCPALWKLSLRGQTALAPLPVAVADCKGLRWLDLSEMGLADLPPALATLPLQDLQDLEAEGKDLEVICDFCRTPYQITIEDLRSIINERKK